MYRLVESQDWNIDPEWIERSYVSLFDKNLIELGKSITSARSIARITDKGSKRAAEFFELMQGDLPDAPQPASNYSNTLISFRQFRELLLIGLCDRATDGVNEAGQAIEDVANYAYTPKLVADEEGLLYAPNWLARSISIFYHDDIINHVGLDTNGNDQLLLNSSALVLAERIVEQYYGDQETTELESRELKKDIFSNQMTRGENGIPASDRVVALDHNSDDYRNAVAALEKVIQELRNDHRLDNELGKEKSALLKALDGGRELLDDTRLDVRVAIMCIVEPLQLIAGKFAEKYGEAVVAGSVVALATEAIKLVSKLIGIG